jgi:hypothetical protein
MGLFISNSLEFIQKKFIVTSSQICFIYLSILLEDFVKREIFTLIKIIKFKFITQSYLLFFLSLADGSTVLSNDLFGLERIYLGNFFYGTFDIREAA